MPDSLPALHTFDIARSDITVWVFRKSGGVRSTAPVFTGRWIATDARLDAKLKGATDAVRNGVTETHPYDLLGQTNEASALSIGTDETYARLAIAGMADPTSSRRAVDLKDVNNADFYVIKFVRNGQSLFAFAKADSSWRSMKSVSITTLLFENAVLTLDDRPRFTISDRFDFFVIGTDLLILNKANFEIDPQLQAGARR